MKFKDYYAVMGLARDATQQQIKQAYRKLARKYHPDVSKEADAEQRFKDVGEAYAVLQDPEKRAAYDQLGTGPKGGEEFRPPRIGEPASNSVVPDPMAMWAVTVISLRPCLASAAAAGRGSSRNAAPANITRA